MAEFWVRHTSTGLSAIGPEDAIELSKLPYGVDLKISVRKPRNSRHHRLFWAICQRLGASLHVNPDIIAMLWKLATGHYEIVRSKKFGDLMVPKSISFANMDQTGFDKFFDAGVQVLYEEWGVTRPDLLVAVEDLLVPTEQRK